MYSRDKFYNGGGVHNSDHNEEPPARDYSPFTQRQNELQQYSLLGAECKVSAPAVESADMTKSAWLSKLGSISPFNCCGGELGVMLTL